MAGRFSVPKAGAISGTFLEQRLEQSGNKHRRMGRIVYILWKKETYILSASEIRGNYGIFQKTAFFQKINLPYPPSPLRCLKSMFFLTDLSEMVTYKITH
jgi:hypothetical protein